jgi:hypothetical protein
LQQMMKHDTRLVVVILAVYGGLETNHV